MKVDRQPMKRDARDEYRMNLPAGQTCGDCNHFNRCNLIFGHIAADEVCDWAPSRFWAKADSGQQGRMPAAEASGSDETTTGEAT